MELYKCDHSNESYRAVPSCGPVYLACVFPLPFPSPLTPARQAMQMFIMLYKVALTFESVD